MKHPKRNFECDPAVIELLRNDLRAAESERERLTAIIASFQTKLETIVKNVSDIVYMLDRNGLITSINNGVARFGFTPSELVGVNIFEIVHPDDRAKAIYRINERRTGERSTKAYAVRFLSKPQNRGGGVEMEGRYPLLTVTAEGQYACDIDDRLSFVGTLGVAREKNDCCVCGPESDRMLIPVCANCKSIRNEAGEWERMERYLNTNFGLRFTHSICPVCTRQLYPEYDIDRAADRSAK